MPAATDFTPRHWDMARHAGYTHTVAFGALLAALLLVGVHADIPAHCLHSQVLGEWELSLSADTYDRHTALCGDKRSVEVAKKMRITLLEPDRACVAGGECGFWTMIYDQGWEVQVGGASYFAFSKYEERASQDEWGDTRTEVISHCGFTSTGWFHRDDNTHWGCYTARKINTTAPSSYFVGAPPTLDNVKFEQDNSFIAFLNEQNLGWEATYYEEWEGLPLASVITRAGGNPADPMSFLAERAEVRTAARRHHHHHHPRDKHGGGGAGNVLVSADPTPVPPAPMGDPHDDPRYAGLPRTWDWRNVKKTSYENPARAQHACGSCYAFAYLSAVETRIALATDNREHTMLSPQHILSCNPYSQGCKGGFPYLVGKFGQDYGFLPETCLPYEATDLPCARSTCDESVARRVHNYTYIGGYYGAGNEVDMMWEIYRKGPIPTAFEVEAPFYHYRSGVFDMPADTSYRLKDKYNFIKTNHGVTIVGWGVEEETGTKYWICKNTWGPTWGMGGYFYFKRGEDTCGIASMASSFDLVL